MKNAKRKVLEMIEQGKITAEEGLELLKILEQKAKEKAKEKTLKSQSEELNYKIEVERQQGDIIKLSPHEYEVLPIKENKKCRSLTNKKPLFGNKPFLGGRKLVIRVEEKGKTIVHLKLPLGFMKPFIKGGLKIGKMQSPEFKKYMEMLDKEELERYLSGDSIGTLIDVYDEKDDQHVYIGIE